MSLRRKLRKLKHRCKERGKNEDKGSSKPYATENSEEDVGNSCNDIGTEEAGSGKEDSENSERQDKKAKDKILDNEKDGVSGDSLHMSKTGKDDDQGTEAPCIEVIKIEEESEEEELINEPDHRYYNSDLIVNPITRSASLKLQSKCQDILLGYEKRKMIPEDKEKFCAIYGLSNFKCCLVEHNYFKTKINDSNSLKCQEQLSGNNRTKNESETTLQFGNRMKFDENRTEQQTIEQRYSTTKHVDSNSVNLSSNSSSRYNLRRNSVNRRNSGVNSIDANNKLNSVKHSTPGSRQSRRCSSNGSSGSSVDLIQDDNPTITRSSCSTRKNLHSRNCELTSEIKTKKSSNSQKQDSKADDNSAADNQLISLDEIAKEISEMEKIIQSKCEILCDNKKVSSAEVKNAEIQPPKLRKISSKENAPESQRDGEYILPMPNLTKMVPEDKNWNLEYTEDDVKNLGLDDLLLRASELNAENFTKALGQNSAPRNGNKSDASEILLSFPNSRRGSDDVTGRDCDVSKGGNAKKGKVDFFKKFPGDDKSGKVDEKSVKKVAEVSPKRPGIKVKTVQNINEEFKDSLGAKLKTFEGRDITAEPALGSKPIYSISDDGQKSSTFIPDGAEQIANNSAASLLSCRSGKTSRSQDQTPKLVENSEETRPFIMTIIQNKEHAGNEHVSPTVATPNVFTRCKSAESGNVLSQLEDRRGENSNNKKGLSDGSEVGENVTLVVSEPRTSRPFEMVNVEEFVPDSNSLHPNKSLGLNSHYVVHFRNGPFAKKKEAEGKVLKPMESGPPVGFRKKHIPFILNSAKKYLRMTSSNGEKTVVGTVEDGSKRIMCASRPGNRLVKYPSEGNVQGEKAQAGEKSSFSMTSVEQKIAPKEAGGRFLKLTAHETLTKSAGVAAEESPKSDEQPTAGGENAENGGPWHPKQQMMSLGAFSSILKDILPDKWILSLDKRYGLQIIKTHLDELLNPSIMISVVVGRSGRVTVNVRGRQLEKTHDLFSNLCDVGNSNEKISINYILAIINKLRFFNVCFGCDDLSLKKYWCEDGFIEYYTEFQQTYRSHICESLVRLGKKRCYPCYRMHESLKKRKRREQLLKKDDAEPSSKAPDPGTKSAVENESSAPANNNSNHHSKGVKRNLEEFLEESFITMRQKIVDEIEKTKEDEENEKVPKTQDEVLSFMGLTRKDSLDVNLRKSKRERKGFKKCESLIGNTVNKEELYFLEKYWSDINILFSTSLLIGAYSRTSTGLLREKCRMFQKLLATWRGIVRDNPDWVGGHINLAENLVDDDVPFSDKTAREKFEKMDVPALRAYIINCVKEVNKIKSRLRTKNTYFKVLYNTFVKPRMKKVRQTPERAEPQETKGDATASKEVAKGESAPDKAEEAAKAVDSAVAMPTEVESSDEKDEDSQHSNGLVPCISDGD